MHISTPMPWWQSRDTRGRLAPAIFQHGMGIKSSSREDALAADVIAVLSRPLSGSSAIVVIEK